MNSKQHIDQFIRDKASGYTPPFDEKNWDKMALLLAKPVQKAGLFRKLMTTAALLLIVSSALWLIKYCTDKPSLTDNITVTQHPGKDSPVSIAKGVGTKSIKTAKDVTFERPTAPTHLQASIDKSVLNKPEQVNAKSIAVKKAGQPIAIVPENPSLTSSLLENSVQPVVPDSFDNMVNLQQNVLIDTGQTATRTDTGTANKVTESVPLPAKKNKNKRHINIDPKWNIGLYAASDFYTLANATSFEGYSIFDKNSFQVSPGVYFSRLVKRTYHISTGLFYTTKSYRINYNGIVNPAYSEVPLYSDYTFNFIEIPLTGSYDYLITDFLSLYISAGIVNQVMLSDEITTSYSSTNNNSNPFENTQKYKASMLVSLGMNYTLSKSLQLDFQPSLRLNLKNGLLAGSNAKHDLIEVREIFPGAYIGLKYIF